MAVGLNEVEEARRTLQTDAWLLRRLSQQSLETSVQEVEAWRRAQGIHLRDSVLHNIPNLAKDAPFLTATPLGRAQEETVTLLDWFCPFSLQVPRMVSLLEERNKSMKELFFKKWSAMHEKIRHSTLTPLPLLERRRRTATQKPTCFEANVCLCGSIGSKIWRVYRWLLDVLKTYCKSESLRKELDSCGIVLRIDISEIIYTKGPQKNDVDDDLSYNQFFSHIALQYFSPYRPTYRKCYWDGFVNHLGHLEITTLPKWVTQFQFCRELADEGKLNEQRRWTATSYKVHTSTRLVTTIRPRILELEDIYQVDPITREFPRRRNTGKAQVKDEWSSRLDDLSDAGSSGSEDEDDDILEQEPDSDDKSREPSEGHPTPSGSNCDATPESPAYSAPSDDLGKGDLEVGDPKPIDAVAVEDDCKEAELSDPSDIVLDDQAKEDECMGPGVGLGEDDIL